MLLEYMDECVGGWRPLLPVSSSHIELTRVRYNASRSVKLYTYVVY